MFLLLRRTDFASMLAQNRVKWKLNPSAALYQAEVFGKASAKIHLNSARNLAIVTSLTE